MFRELTFTEHPLKDSHPKEYAIYLPEAKYIFTTSTSSKFVYVSFAIRVTLMLTFYQNLIDTKKQNKRRI